MRQFLLFIIISLIFISCGGQTINRSKSNEQDKVCRELISSLTSDNYEMAVNAMDDIVLNKVSKDTLKIAMAGLASTLKDEFEGNITDVSFVTSEKTVLNNLPALFMIYKLEGKTKFGFYYFYLNENSNKVMLISRFTKVEPKRK